jgi:uncharacterized membrane protein SpoIIM required for sporulation
MFLRIFFNNFMVVLLQFGRGITLGIWTFYAAFTNGIMLGSFHYMLYEGGVLGTSLQTVYIHGAIEIPCIFIGGGAGYALGLSLLFPGTLSRGAAFTRAALNGVRIILALVPLILLAAIMESFVTRYYQTSSVLNISIIALEVGFMGFYFGLYPFRVARREAQRQQVQPRRKDPATYQPAPTLLDT